MEEQNLAKLKLTYLQFKTPYLTYFPTIILKNCHCSQGRFEILSLSGSFLHAPGGTSCRNGGLSICLSGADGRVIGGGVGGPLLATGTVQVHCMQLILYYELLGFLHIFS